ncbi:MAG TPA: prepilin-type N-terminal cleavage/methylation domain-containing protein, partial [Gemmatales bacterium]|nr:prepilin-type N-terminal cleavage/methylation domain-containing protein [Gemmatales bacterium]
MRLQKRPLRKAFTLIELIVVVSIIVVIASLTIGAISRGYVWIRQKNTEQTMTKAVERIVQRRITQIYKEAIEWDTPPVLYRQAQGDSRRAEALKVLYLYKWSFPHTYSEAFHNLQESLALYDSVNGYPLARSIYQRLKSNVPTAMPDLIFTACPTPVEMPRILPKQNAACLMAAFNSIIGSSADQFTNEELSVLSPYVPGVLPSPDNVDVPAQATVLPDGTNMAGGYPSQNTMLVDNWGTPIFALRHGNFWESTQAPRTLINRAPFWLGLRNPSIAPINAVLGDQFYDILVNNPTTNRGRAFIAFSSRWNTDPFDPEGLFRNSEAWRANAAPAGVWLTGTHLCPPAPG